MRRFVLRTAVWTIAAVAALTLGVAAGPVVWHLAGDSGRVRPQVTALPDRAAPAPSIAPILALAPFGAAPVAAPAAPAAAQETSLGLTLLGVMIAEPASLSRAVIAPTGGKSAIYSVGSRLPGEAVLLGVAARQVVLSVNGTREILSFPDPDAARPVGVQPGLAAGVLGTQPTARADTPDAIIASIRARIDTNPKAVLEQIGLEPTDQGYRIATRHDSGVDRAGLRAGDIVTSVNGQPVGDLESDRKLYDEVAASGRARLEVLRGEAKFVMTFPLR